MVTAVTSVVALLTCHNRVSTTLMCLESLVRQRREEENFTLEVILVDADSGDGTGRAVEERFPGVTLVRVPSSVHWGTGTRIGALAANDRFPDSDYLLWLNDDVMLAPDAIQRLLATAASPMGGRGAVIVGQLADADGRATYGGYFRGRRPLEFVPVGPRDVATQCATMNGNVVLVPSDVSKQLGHIDRRFPHRMGDIDFGLRAADQGVPVIQAAGVIGTCSLNTDTHVAGSTAWHRLRTAVSVKFFPPRAWWTFCMRHGGAMALAYFAKPYLLAVIGQTKRSRAGRDT